MPDTKRFDVVGLGQCSFDILGRLSEFPAPDQKSELNEIKFQGGGPVATALVALSRLGVSVSFCGRVGDDDFGQKIQAGLVEENVDCRSLLIDKGATSQVAFIAVVEGGHRNIFWHRGTARPIKANEVDNTLIAQSKVLHLDGLQHEASVAAARTARDNGVITVLDGGSVREGTAALLPLIDHLVVSEKFANQLIPEGSVEEKLGVLLSFGAVAATITSGVKGSWTQERGGLAFHQATFNVDVVDTTGCGDVFHGAYIYGLLQGWELPRIVKAAAACAALKTRQLGGRTAIPTLAEIINIIDTKVI